MQAGNTLCIDVSQPYGTGSQRLMWKDFKQSTGRVVHTISSSVVHNAANPTSEGSPYTKWRPFNLTLLGILKMSLILLYASQQ